MSKRTIGWRVKWTSYGESWWWGSRANVKSAKDADLFPSSSVAWCVAECVRRDESGPVKVVRVVRRGKAKPVDEAPLFETWALVAKNSAVVHMRDEAQARSYAGAQHRAVLLREVRP